MNTPTDAPEVARSYREFLDSFQANDDKAVRQSYRELLRLGRPRAEILDEAVRLFGTNNAGLDTFGDRLAKSNPVEPLGSADRIARLRTSTKISNGAERTFGVNAATLSIAAPNSCNGQTTPEPTVEFNLQRVQPSNQVHSAENVAREMAIYPYGHRVKVVLKSSFGRLSMTIGFAVLALVTTLPLPPAASIAEKALTFDGAAGTAAPSVPRPTIPITINPTMTRATAGPTSATDSHGLPPLPEPAKSEERPTDPADESASISTMPYSAMKAVVTDDKAVGKAVGPSPTTPRSAGADRVGTLSPLTSQKAAVVKLPETTKPRLNEPSGPASFGALLPHATPTIVPAVQAAPGRESPISKPNMAMLLERGDLLFGTGDLASARLFYERAADAGDGQAALRLGETYDPHFLERAHLRGVRGDVGAAAFWYKRARDFGMSEAEILLGSLQSK